MENLVKIFTENVARGNFVQIGPNFPAKSLSIYTKKVSWHPFNWKYFIRENFETNKCFTECDLLSERQTLYFWLVY